MILLFLAVLLLISGLIFTPKWHKDPNRGRTYPPMETTVRGWAGPIALGVSAFLFLCFGVGLVVSNQHQYVDINQIREDRQEIRVYTAKVEAIKENIKGTLATYPDYEKMILHGITPQILLAYPDLKSNQIVTAEFKALDDNLGEITKNQVDMAQEFRQIQNRQDDPDQLWIFHTVKNVDDIH